jgi:hypothetical protein
MTTQDTRRSVDTRPAGSSPAAGQRRYLSSEYWSQSDPGWEWIVGIIAVLVLLGLVAIFFLDRGLTQPGASAVAAPGVPVGATPGVIEADFGFFDGRAVAVTGRVQSVVGQRAIVLSGLGDPVVPGAQGAPAAPAPPAAPRAPGAPAAPASQILVVSPRQIGPLAPGSVVQLVGTVRRFDQAAIERELGVDLTGAPGTNFAQWNGRPVIVAGSIMPAG